MLGGMDTDTNWPRRSALMFQVTGGGETTEGCP